MSLVHNEIGWKIRANCPLDITEEEAVPKSGGWCFQALHFNYIGVSQCDCVCVSVWLCMSVSCLGRLLCGFLLMSKSLRFYVSMEVQCFKKVGFYLFKFC